MSKAAENLNLRLALGGVAGAIAQTVCQPIETTKVRLQNEASARAAPKYHNFFRGIQVIAREEGARALYKGLSPAIGRELCYSSLRFGLYVPIKTLLGENPNEATPFWKKLAAGGLAGGLGSAIANPTDLLKIRMQADNALRPTSLTAHAKIIYESGGVLGFWTGVSTTVQRAVILGATKLATYDESKIRLRNYLGLTGLPQQVGASMMAGFAYVCTTAPVDLARTRFMTAKQIAQQTGAKVEYKSGMDVIIQTVKKEGPLALYKGFFPQWARAAPYTVVQSLAWEQLSNACGIKTV